MVRMKDVWYLFFEVMNSKSGKGEIGLAISKDCRAWTYQNIVLKEEFHLSYPYVFESDGDYYMIPESCERKLRETVQSRRVSTTVVVCRRFAAAGNVRRFFHF